jgi:hypothetical protein
VTHDTPTQIYRISGTQLFVQRNGLGGSLPPGKLLGAIESFDL